MVGWTDRWTDGSSRSSSGSFVHLCVKALKSVWKDHRQRNGLKDEEPADNLLTSIELVLDNHNQLVEMNRLPGENEVCCFFSADPRSRCLIAFLN